MRKMPSIGIAGMLTAIAVTAWAMTAIQPQKHAEAATVGIDVFMLMAGATNLQIQHYEAF
jgi:hypothetical protein